MRSLLPARCAIDSGVTKAKLFHRIAQEHASAHRSPSHIKGCPVAGHGLPNDLWVARLCWFVFQPRPGIALPDLGDHPVADPEMTRSLIAPHAVRADFTNLIGCEFCRVMPFPSRHAALSCRVFHVLSLSARVQVRGLDTTWIVALMQRGKTLAARASTTGCMFQRGPVSRLFAKMAISEGSDAAEPQQTSTVRLWHRVVVKKFSEWDTPRRAGNQGFRVHPQIVPPCTRNALVWSLLT